MENNELLSHFLSAPGQSVDFETRKKEFIQRNKEEKVQKELKLAKHN